MKGGVYQHDGTLEVEDYARGITESYDNKGIQDPFSIIDLDVVKRNLDLWNRALPSVKPFYAIKCNPDLNILRTLSAHGACFDCASLQEMDTILSNGLAEGEDIILAHPIKSRRCIEYAIRNGVTLMTFDSVEELRKIVSTTSKARLILRIRVSGFESLVDLNKKFGADETTSKLILHEAARLGAKIHGISFHIGSGVENCQPLALSLANARNLLDYGRMLGHPISILDIGGGFMNSSPQKFLKVGNFIENTLSSCFEGISLTVIAEPGRFLVTDAQYVVACVSQVVLKSVNEDLPTSYSIFINDGVYGTFNFVLTEQRKVHGKPLLKREGSMRADIWGPTCCSFDIIEVEIFHLCGVTAFSSCCMPFERELSALENFYFSSIYDGNLLNHRLTNWEVRRSLIKEAPISNSVSTKRNRSMNHHSDRRISTVHEGDWILYPQCGAYSTCLSTHFNGFYPPNILYLISASNWSTIANAMRGNEVISERIPSKM